MFSGMTSTRVIGRMGLVAAATLSTSDYHYHANVGFSSIELRTGTGQGGLQIEALNLSLAKLKLQKIQKLKMENLNPNDQNVEQNQNDAVDPAQIVLEENDEGNDRAVRCDFCCKIYFHLSWIFLVIAVACLYVSAGDDGPNSGAPSNDLRVVSGICASLTILFFLLTLKFHKTETPGQTDGGMHRFRGHLGNLKDAIDQF